MASSSSSFREGTHGLRDDDGDDERGEDAGLEEGREGRLVVEAAHEVVAAEEAQHAHPPGPPAGGDHRHRRDGTLGAATAARNTSVQHGNGGIKGCCDEQGMETKGDDGGLMMVEDEWRVMIMVVIR